MGKKKDGSVTVELTPEQRAFLDAMASISARWNTVTQAHSPRKRAVDLGWTCGICESANLESDLVCGFCDTPRPTAQTES